MMHIAQKNGFTLLEFIAAVSFAAILGISISSIYYFQAKIVKDISSRVEMVINSDVALAHLTKSVRNSAWLEIPGNGTVKLHSHSYPKIREYTLSNGDLIYKQTDAKNNKTAETLIKGIGQDLSFSGVGTAKRAGIYTRIAVTFTKRTGNEAYTVKAEIKCNESANLIFVSGNSKNTVEDGTLQLPFKTIEAANALCNTQFPSSQDMIYILDGNIDLSRDTTFLLPMIYVSPNASLAIASGTKLKFGSYTILVVETPVISWDNISLGSYSSSAWGGVLFNAAGSVDSISCKNVEFYGSMLGLAVPGGTADSQTSTFVNASIKNSLFYNNYNALRLETNGDVSITDNTFIDNDISCIITSQTTKRTTSKTFKNTQEIIGNTISRSKSFLPSKNGYGIYTNFAYSIPAVITTIISDNHISCSNVSSKYCGISARLLYGSIPVISNNEITGCPSGLDVTISGQADISNNTIDGKNLPGSLGAYFYAETSGISNLSEFRNNDIKNVKSIGLSLKNGGDNTNIRNNYINGGIEISSTYDSATGRFNINNNVIYGDILIQPTKSQSNLFFYNNIMVNGVLKVNPVTSSNTKLPSLYIKNCVLWDNYSIDPATKNLDISYSIIKGYPENLSKGIIDRDPLFSGTDFRLSDTPPNISPGINGGDPKIKDTDKTVSDMGIYGGPAGLYWDKGVGAK